MRAEEARELASKCHPVDISRYLDAIKRCATDGDFSVTFGDVSKLEVEELLKLGYNIEEEELKTTNGTRVTIKW